MKQVVDWSSMTMYMHNTQLVSVCSDGDIRLVGGANAQEGRVEFCNDDTWGTVCDDFWDTADASVVCRQLGFPPQGPVAFSNAVFGQGTGPILLDNVACTGSESRLANCSHMMVLVSTTVDTLKMLESGARLHHQQHHQQVSYEKKFKGTCRNPH